MKEQDLREIFSELLTFRQGDKKATNKPLLILYALGKLKIENKEKLKFAECEEDYKELLKAFGRLGTSRPKPKYAFYRLKNDSNGKIWRITDPDNLLVTDASGDVRVKDLRKESITAGFTDEFLNEFKNDQLWIKKITQHILDGYFSESLHSSILDSVGLSEFASESSVIKRDPKFSTMVKTAYKYQCAVCRYALRLAGNEPIGLDAAHIKAIFAGGSNEVTNGIALCSLHHILFDRGAFTILRDYHLIASEKINSEGENIIMNFHGKKIFLPYDPDKKPDAEFLDWHHKNVFSGNPHPFNH